MMYKAIPGPQLVSIPKGKPQAATDLFADMISREAQNGWVYHSMEELTVQEKIGCFLSPQYVNTSIYMLIFYHE